MHSERSGDRIRVPLSIAFAVLAAVVPVLIALQLFLVGLAVFSDAAAWDAHRAVGGTIALPVLALAVAATVVPGLRRFRSLALALLGLYAMQFVWLIAGREAGSGAVQSLHAANAMALAVTGLALARRCTPARRRAGG
ncbi:DUF6220 domain-containing protein [Arenibaculum pallidiluteum]|uniref:DUF6220 domain-containing protein n=1 Tax=Arenibaculum pallidiluteum TaxID=2812559 RepID=UPI001A979665|nr:DUF6220 domain-containing protein [Arenibaculum pallidiluteum]